MEWGDLGVGLALVMIFEGLLPFLSPGKFKDSMRRVQDIPDSALRVLGLSGMIIGLIVIYAIR